MVDLLVKGLAVTTIPVFAYLLGTEELGRFAEWYSLYNILFAVISLGIPAYFLVLMGKGNKTDELDFQLLRVYCEWLLFVLIVLMLIGYYAETYWFEIITLFIASISFFAVEYMSSKYRFTVDVYKYSWLQMASTASTYIVPLLIVYIVATAEVRMIAMCVSLFLLKIILLFLNLNLNLNLNVSGNVFAKQTLRFNTYSFGLPLVLMSLVSWLKLGGDIQYLKFYSGYDVVGNLAFAFQILSIVSIVAASLNRAATVDLYRMLESGAVSDWYNLIKKLTIVVAVIAVSSVVGLWIVTKFLLPDYQLAIQFFVPMVLGTVIYSLGQLLASKLLYSEESFKLTFALIVSSCLHPLVSFIILNYLDLSYLGFSYLLGNLLFTFIVAYFVMKKVAVIN